MAFDKDRVLLIQQVGGAVLSIIIAGIIVTNLSLIAAILWSAQLRSRLRNLAISCLAASDLLLGLFGASLIADRYIRNDWIHGCATQLVMFVFMNHAQEFVATWYIVLLNMDYIIRLFNPKVSTMAGPLKVLLYILLLILPWASMCVVVIPIYSSRIHPNVREMWRSNFCPPIISYTPFATMTTLGFFIPAAIILNSSVIMIIAYMSQKKKFVEPSMSADLIRNQDSPPVETENCSIEHPMCFIIPGILTVALHLPLSIFHLTPGVWNNYERGLTFWIILLVIRISKAALVPLAWLTIRDIRAEVKSSFLCKCCRRTSGDENGHATYRRFPEHQTNPSDDPIVTISCR